MGPCGNLGSVLEPLLGAITEQPSCSDFSEEPISEKEFCFEGVGNLMDCKEDGTIDPNQCSCDFRDKNPSFSGSNCVMETTAIDKVDEMKGDSKSRVGAAMSISGEKETRANSNRDSSALDVGKVETGGLCFEKLGSEGQHTSSSPPDTAQAVSVAKTTTEANGKCSEEIERLQVRNTLTSSPERQTEGSNDGVAVISNDNANQDGFISEGLELTRRLTPNASLLVNCNNPEEGLEIQGDLLTKAVEDSGVFILPLEGSEMDTQLTFIADSPGHYLKQCKSLEAIKEGNNAEIGGEGTNCTSNVRVEKETNENLTDRAAASSDYTSCVQSCQSLSESILETGVSGRGTAFNDLKASSEMRGNDMPQLLTSQVKEDNEKDDKNVLCSDDLNDFADSKTISPDLELLNEANLHSDIPVMNEEMMESSACGLPSGNASAALTWNSDMAANITAGNFSQLSPMEENACSMEAGSPIVARSSFGLDLPCISERGAIDVSGFNDTVDWFRPTDDDCRIGSEVACASGAHFPETILSYSRRRGRDGKQSKKTKKKRIASSSRKSSRVKQLQINFESIFNCSKQKRSCLSKSARSSEWGLPSKTEQMFCQGNNLTSERPSSQGSQKSQSNQRNGEVSKNYLSECAEGSNRKHQTSRGGCLRLKVKFGKTVGLNPLNIVVSEVTDKSLPTDDSGMAGAGLEIPSSTNFVKDKLRNGESSELLEANNNPDKDISDKEPDDSLMGKSLEAGELRGNLVGDAADDELLLSSGIVVEECGRVAEERYTDAETSPDSEVINSVPDTVVGARPQGDLHPTVLSTCKAFATDPVDVIKKIEDKKKGSKKDKSSCASRSYSKDGSPIIGSVNKSKQPKCQQMIEKRESSSLSQDILSSPTSEKSSSYTHCSEDLPSELGVLEENLKLENCKDAQMHPRFGPKSAESRSSKKVLASAKSKGKSKGPEVAQSSKCNGTKKGKSKFSDSAKSRRRNAPVLEKDQQKPINKSMGKDDAGDQDTGRAEFHGATGCHINGDTVKTSAVSSVISPDFTEGEMVLGGTNEESTSPDSAWVRCDECLKWRRIPASLVESIDENCRWICADNLAKDFADCLIPQEMSNQEINAELGITQDEADAYDGDLQNKGKDKGQECRRSSVNQKACFKAIKINQFLHRNRKAQTIDEIMVCHCKLSPDGQSGCGYECLNRMLNIECVQGTCPCGDLCSNQQFQRRKYTRFERFHSGKKGYGLRLLEDVHKGQFLIEYVGEVLDMQSYEARQKEYAAKGQKHFYFMTLNGNEVIDAGAKGNLGRFINHSCEPNCRTEKWMVNGEICVGIFSLRDIKKGEEVTFDYNYVRVFGAAAKRCYCGSLHCRGYIGGDPLNGDVIIQSDSDEEYPEPVMLEDDESGDAVLDATATTCSDGAVVQMVQNQPEINNTKDHASAVFQSQSSVSAGLLEKECVPSLRPTEVSREHTTGMSIATVQQEIPIEGESTNTPSPSVVVSRLSSNNADTDKKTKHGSSEDKRMFSRPRPLMKTARSSGSIKGDKGPNPPGVKKAQIVMANKLQQQPIKSKGSTEVSSSGRIETLEGKLNELLDAEGGISKRKDSTKGYLKLLLLTAASRGNANNEGIQSNRDLSMILDALLKTKSRAVLVDVIDKNGLQMLHNIMKQYRRDFKKTPILRKLLKVLEYLAAREILSLEHIIRRPPCPGMESFKDSILTLTEHDDKQVHQIARNFRDRWIPKPFRKPRYMDRDERFESTKEHLNNGSRTLQYDNQYVRPAEPVSGLSSRAATSETASVSEGGSEPNSSAPETNGTRMRKRKSRWDQPAMKKERRTDSPLPQKIDETKDNHNIHDDIPPGFTSPLKQPCNNAPEIVVVQPQLKFLSRLPVSYGIPLSIVHEFGSPDKDSSDSWLVAPAMPFHPFPPLPPVSRESYFSRKNGSVSSSLGSSSTNEHCSGQSIPSTAVSNQGCWNIPAPGAEAKSAYNRKRGFSFDIGKRYFRQQKWNVPPWIRNGWGNAGNNFNNAYCSQGTGFNGVEPSGYNSSHQQH